MAKLSPDQLDPRNNLQWYTRSALRNADVWTPANIRKEYSRLRDIAEKRLKRLAISEPESFAYKQNIGKYAPVRELTTEEARALMPELARFIAAKTGTVRGIRQAEAKAVKSLREQGFAVTKENIKDFGKYMQAWKESQKGRKRGLVTSGDAAESYEFFEQNKIPLSEIKDDFNKWVKAQKRLETYTKKQNKKGGVTSKQILDEFHRLLEKK